MPAKPKVADLVNDVRQHVDYFAPNAMAQLGTESSHQVFFGDMPSLGPVAVKPYVHKRGKDSAVGGSYSLARVRGERAALEKASSLGIRALEPLAIAAGGLASYLFTRYQPGLNHLGMVDWNVGIADRRLHSVIAPTLLQAAGTAAEWHGSGAAHGDFQPKNLTYLNSGQSVFGDGEGASFHPDPANHGLAADRDMKKLGMSTLYWGLLADRSPTYRAGYLGDQLLEPYLEAIDSERFALEPDQRRQVITDYWVQAATGKKVRNI